MKNSKKGVLLINLGTPDSPSVVDVRRYLKEFLMDERVIDIPFLNRFFLIHGIIAPTRAPQSAKIYKDLWTKEGSPLKVHGLELKKRLQEALGLEYVVAIGMRYQNPSIASALEELKGKGLSHMVVIPLYPQYASASTGSSIQKFFEEIKSWPVIPRVAVISQFFADPLFIKAFAEIGRLCMAKARYDHFVFTYHGLPERQILKSAVDGYCQLTEKCCSVYHAKNRFCYRAQCFETTRLLAKELGISAKDYSVCFQSRLGKDPWIKPYTDQMIPELTKRGIKNVLAFSPSFVADCLETTIEIGVEYRKLFIEHNGKRWDLVESLNVYPAWVECLRQMVLNSGNSGDT